MMHHMSKNCWQILSSEYAKKIEQDFLDIIMHGVQKNFIILTTFFSRYIHFIVSFKEDIICVLKTGP